MHQASTRRAGTMAFIGISTLLLASPTIGRDAGYRAAYHLPPQAAYDGVNEFPLAVTEAHRDPQGNLLEVTYVMPADLTGNSGEEMTMVTEATDDPEFIKLICHRTGSAGFCARGTDSLTCSIRFRDFIFDETKALAYVRQKHAQDPRLPQWEAAVRAFRNDAIGVLQLTSTDGGGGFSRQD